MEVRSIVQSLNLRFVCCNLIFITVMHQLNVQKIMKTRSRWHFNIQKLQLKAQPKYTYGTLVTQLCVQENLNGKIQLPSIVPFRPEIEFFQNLFQFATMNLHINQINVGFNVNQGIQCKSVTGSLSLSTDKTCHCHLLNQQSGSCVQMLPCCTAAYYTIGCWLWEKLFETSI